MSNDPEEPEYRVYRGDGATPAGRRKRPTPPPASRGTGADGGPADFEYSGTGGSPWPSPRASRRPPEGPGRDAGGAARRADSGAPDYRVYRSQPRGLGARLRGESDSDVGSRLEEAERAGANRRERGRGAVGGAGVAGGRFGRRGAHVARAPRRRGLGRWGAGTWSVRRVLKYLVSAVVAWVLLSAVLFMISAQSKAGNIPKQLAAALSPASTPMLLSAQNVLVLGLDTRPKSGYSAKEGGLTAADTNEATSRTDTIMIWHVGGGVSRKLSIPRDTLVNVPGVGQSKINAAWAAGSDGPGTTVKVVEALTGIKINHVIVVDLGNFASFIDDIGGVTVTTPKICSNISGGAKNGGYTLNLSPGSHHLTGTEALTLARTRDNSCNLAYTDIQREKMQQEIMNGIKSQLFSLPAFLHLPVASWDAPGVIQTDMGGPTLLQLFASAELGGSSKAQTLSESNQVYNGQDVLIPRPSDTRAKVNQLLHG